ncbi:Protein CBG16843 [Caenorhabditis briggsae]|uniref:Uncharacterized protein n=2 Tax=Caenorhabditis briggsae TaxID=6238 RepID=A0AAE9JS54_CAEBR|nr:Protein CBG16843 [Caenorhabditis briggsae]ULT83292.1 hypothetical protein L3Y34_012496 [Caenorhabditis briggsae]UMM42573.1 hypothetical protein L5515_018352 [Caenorhabditis briggsae]CAP34701.1 Protein CBG16843 [Caenorhabditis briggsae]
MAAYNPDAAATQPERVVGFFVPESSAAFVTEMLELALSNTPGVTVYAGEMSRIVLNTNSNDSERAEDTDDDSDTTSSDDECQDSTVSSSSNKRKVPQEASAPKRRKIETTDKSTNFSCDAADRISMVDMVKELERKYGQPSGLPNGRATAPRLMIQYPGLPYPAPVHQEFANCGLPRQVVDFNGRGMFKPTGTPVFNGSSAT